MASFSDRRFFFVVRYPKFLDPFPDQLKVDLDKIRAEGTYIWPFSKKAARRPVRKPRGGGRRWLLSPPLFFNFSLKDCFDVYSLCFRRS